MSDKNIEIIKSIQKTGHCPESTPSLKLTKIITEGKSPTTTKENRMSVTVYDSDIDQDK